jgi:hypothetical protein
MPLKYQKFGLRRDKNLSDIDNPTQALGNILDNLVDADVDFQFVPEDLLQAITGLRNTTLTAEDIQKTKGTVRTYTDDNGNAIPFEPLQTIEDNIRNFKVYVGEPPFAGGGDGIEALFVPNDAMVHTQASVTWGSISEATKKAYTGDQLFNSSYTAPNKIEPGLEGPFDFWDNGVFIFGSKLYDEFTDTFGLVQWEGYVQGGQRFDMETTGLLKIEVDPLDDGNWEFIKNVYDENRTNILISTSSYDATEDVTTLTLDDTEDSKVICVNDVVDFGGANTFSVATLTQTQFTVEGDATANGNVTFPTTADFSFDMGAEEFIETGDFVRVPSAATGGLVKLRISYYFPDTGDGRNFPNKRFVDVDEDGTDRIAYSNFYTEVPTGNPGIYTYEYFEDNRLSKRRKFISPRNNSGNNSTALQTSKLIFANYTPPETIGNRYRGAGTVLYKGNDKFQALSSSYTAFSVGDWVALEVFAGGTRKTLVAPIQDISSVEIDEVDYREFFIDNDTMTTFKSTHGSITVDDECVSHVWSAPGLIGLIELTSNGSTTNFNIANMTGGEKYSYENAINDILSDYMVGAVVARMDNSGNVSGSSSSYTHFKRIQIPNGATNNFNVLSIYSGDSYTPTSTSGTKWIAGVYSHTGLQDLSTLSQCQGTYGVEVTATASAGQAQVTVSNTSSITQGDYVQFGNTSGGTSYVSAYIPAGVTVQSIDSATQITLSQNIQTAIPKNATLVFIDSAYNPGSNAKEFCVLPLNTAPPFTGTDDGLRTTTTSAPYSDATNFPNLVAEKLIFAEGEFPDVTTLTAVDLTTNPQYGRTLPIEYNGTTYKFLIA